MVATKEKVDVALLLLEKICLLFFYFIYFIVLRFSPLSQKPKPLYIFTIFFEGGGSYVERTNEFVRPALLHTHILLT